MRKFPTPPTAPPPRRDTGSRPRVPSPRRAMAGICTIARASDGESLARRRRHRRSPTPHRRDDDRDASVSKARSIRSRPNLPASRSSLPTLHVHFLSNMSTSNDGSHHCFCIDSSLVYHNCTSTAYWTGDENARCHSSTSSQSNADCAVSSGRGGFKCAGILI